MFAQWACPMALGKPQLGLPGKPRLHAARREVITAEGPRSAPQLRGRNGPCCYLRSDLVGKRFGSPGAGGPPTPEAPPPWSWRPYHPGGPPNSPQRREVITAEDPRSAPQLRGRNGPCCYLRSDLVGKRFGRPGAGGPPDPGAPPPWSWKPPTHWSHPPPPPWSPHPGAGDSPTPEAHPPWSWRPSSPGGTSSPQRNEVITAEGPRSAPLSSVAGTGKVAT